MALKEKLQKDGSAISQVFRSRNAAVLFGLGFSSGLPLLLSGNTLKTWLTEANISLVTIGVFGMITIPYSLKLLWAPFLDRFQVPFLGRRRGWILLSQLGLMGALGLLALFGTSTLGVFAVCAALVAFFSASQDIVIDGYRADLLTSKEIAMGMTIFLLGYRLGMLAAGVGANVLGDAIGTKEAPENWSIIYLIMASLLVFGIVATFFGPEPQLKAKPPTTIAGSFEYPFLAFLQRHKAFAILAFVFVFKLADTLLSITTTFYLQLGFTKTELAAITKVFGTIVAMVGITAGGVMAAKLGFRRALLLGGIATAVANLSFTALALVGKSYTVLVLAIVVDNFFEALVSVPFNSFLVSLCVKRFSATQYAVLASISSMGGRLLSGLSGYLAQSMGWPLFFASTLLAAIPGLLLLSLLPRESVEPQLTTEEEKTQSCSRCGAEVPESLSYCDTCGAFLNMEPQREEELRPVLSFARRGILMAGFLTAFIGVLFPVTQWGGWGVDRSIPFVVIHFWLLTLHVGLWAWSKLSPRKAVMAGVALALLALVSDLYFRAELLVYLIPARALVLGILLAVFGYAKRAEKMRSEASAR